MNLKKKIIILFGVFLILFMNRSTYKSFAERKNIDIVEDIITMTKGEIVESGFKTSFFSKDKNNSQIENIKENLTENNPKIQFYNTIDKENFYSVDFTNSEYSGYLREITENQEKVVTIFANAKSYEFKLDKLENICNTILDAKNINNFKYVRVKLNDSNLKKISNQIVSELSKNGASNIESLKLEHGYSIVAYTGRYNPIFTNNKYIDLNIALCNYESGNYMIIGTPEIIINY